MATQRFNFSIPLQPITEKLDGYEFKAFPLENGLRPEGENLVGLNYILVEEKNVSERVAPMSSADVADSSFDLSLLLSDSLSPRVRASTDLSDDAVAEMTPPSPSSDIDDSSRALSPSASFETIWRLYLVTNNKPDDVKEGFDEIKKTLLNLPSKLAVSFSEDDAEQVVALRNFILNHCRPANAFILHQVELHIKSEIDKTFAELKRADLMAAPATRKMYEDGVLFEALKNAERAGAKEFSVYAEERGSSLTFIIRDTGPGLPPKYCNKNAKAIFLAPIGEGGKLVYVRAMTSTKKGGGDLGGCGMALVLLATKHTEDIEIEFRNVEAGDPESWGEHGALFIFTSDIPPLTLSHVIERAGPSYLGVFAGTSEVKPAGGFTVRAEDGSTKKVFTRVVDEAAADDAEKSCNFRSLRVSLDDDTE